MNGSRRLEANPLPRAVSERRKGGRWPRDPPRRRTVVDPTITYPVL